jgi:hypothetical protein
VALGGLVCLHSKCIAADLASCVWFLRGYFCLQSKKGLAIKDLVRREFQKGRSETDPEKIEALKAKYVGYLAAKAITVVLLLSSVLWIMIFNLTVFPSRSAVRGLSNYLMLANSSKDQRLHDAMNKKTPPKDDGPQQAEFRDL